MKFHSQNLCECACGRPNGPKALSGRAWIRGEKEFHAEWHFGKYSRSFRWGWEFGHGDSEDGVMLFTCVPFLFSIYVSFSGIRRCKPHQYGISVHDNSVYLYLGSWVNEWCASDPWYRKSLSFTFPWELSHFKTEILSHAGEVVYTEQKGEGRLGDGSFEKRQAAEKSVQRDYPYTYRLKNGEVQERVATVHVDRMEWRARWWPIIHRRKVRTSIYIRFSDEVGERSGSWKGGCTGCGYEMLPGESPVQTLRRMEIERTFK